MQAFSIVIQHWILPSNQIYRKSFQSKLTSIIENKKFLILFLICEYSAIKLPDEFLTYIQKTPVHGGWCQYCKIGRNMGRFDLDMVYFECQRCQFPGSTYFINS